MLKVNSYFEDKVKSIAFTGESLPATVGVISPGAYEFDTKKHEVITIVSGLLNVKLPHSEQWQSYKTGETFEVDAHQTFGVSTEVDTAYLCTYS